ncbi:MAG: hypothetical protein ACI4SL_00040, partial [Candidatus Ornithospirochaeta sp.]
TYPAQSDAFVVAAVKQLENDAKWAADQLFGTAVAKAEEKAPEVVEEVPAEAPATPEAPAPEPVAPEPFAPVVAPEPVAPVVAPEPKAVETIGKFNASIAATANFNTAYAAPFYPTFEARFGYDFTSQFSAGLTVGYDMDGYVPFGAYAKYNLPVLEGLYVAADAGARVGLQDRGMQYVVGAAVGYEYSFTEKVSAFAEAGIDYNFTTKKVVPGFTVGAKITF